MSRKIIASGACFVLLLFSASLSQANGQTYRRPLGVYARVDVDVALKRKFGTSNPKPEKEHAYLQGLYLGLLKDEAVSGLTLGVHWDQIEVSAPDCELHHDCLPPTELTQGYDWSWLDDAFTVANAAGASVQLIVTPGVDSPPWVLALLPSCDQLFTHPKDVPTDCSKVTFSEFPEKKRADSHEMPLPWPANGLYEYYWEQFLTGIAINYDNPVYGRNPAFVSIAIAGPICASDEMILPTSARGSTQKSGEPADEAWSMLIQNSYPKSSSAFQHSDQVFIDQWKRTIDAYERIFSDITLFLSPDAGGDLPEYDVVTPPAHPGELYRKDCSDTSYPLSCDAKTRILSYFLGTKAGNRKATQVGGMTASSQTTPGDIGIAGLKVLTSLTTQTPPILGGAEFDLAVSDPTPATRQHIGCPEWPKSTCSPLNAEEAAYNVLKVFFDGTEFALYYGGTPDEPIAAPIQWLDIDYLDVVYAQDHPNPPKNSTVPCNPALQDLLDRASWDLFTIANKTPPVPTPSCN